VCRGVALLGGAQVVAQLAHHPRQCLGADHGAKNGVLT
jgi:muramidase (phage lysozyme)